MNRSFQSILLSAVGLILLSSGMAMAGNIGQLNIFAPNTPANAEDVNKNFEDTKAAVNDNNSRISANETAIGTKADSKKFKRIDLPVSLFKFSGSAATFDANNFLTYVDAAVTQAYSNFLLPMDRDPGSPLTITALWKTSSVTTQDVRWALFFLGMTEGEPHSVNGFGAQNEVSTNSGSSNLNSLSWTIADGTASGAIEDTDVFANIFIRRVGTDATDNLAATATLVAVYYEYVSTIFEPSAP